jgi:hypothetical protein
VARSHQALPAGVRAGSRGSASLNTVTCPMCAWTSWARWRMAKWRSATSCRRICVTYCGWRRRRGQIQGDIRAGRRCPARALSL